MALSAYLVSYDISDAARWRKVYRVMTGAGERVQYSVFRCVLSELAREELITRLDAIIHHEEDQVLLVDLGPEKGRGASCFVSLGRKYVVEERKAIIV
jgi:CRISPR-associated protein Cas2